LKSKGDKEPESRALLKSLCDRKIGSLFKKCKDDGPASSPRKGEKKDKDKQDKDKKGDNKDKDKKDKDKKGDKKDKDKKGDEKDKDKKGDKKDKDKKGDEKDKDKKGDKKDKDKKGDKKDKDKKDKDKGKRDYPTTVDGTNNDLIMLLDELSSTEKSRLLIAVEEGDEAVVNAIFNRFL
jgi:hypothetical protein